MKRKSRRPRKQPTGDPKDPKGMVALMEQFCEWMQVRNYSEKTVETRQQQIRPLHRLGGSQGRDAARRSHQTHRRTLPAVPLPLPQPERQPA